MAKMKAMYLHGLDSYPLPQKVEILEKAGFEVYAPLLDYRHDKNLYQHLRREAMEQKIEFLIGSSLGGFTAFWLGEDLELPCLLFNPAMSYSDQLMEYLPEIEIGNCPARFVVIGRYDDVIDPDENLKFFREQENDNCHQRVLVCDWLEHQIDFQSFEELVDWAASSYRIFKRNNN